jgi:SAM-dependent methyltransferase
VAPVDGVLGADYHEKRKTLRSHRYRLQRRTHEVEQAIRRYAETPVKRLVDVGTADGMMLDALVERFGEDLQCFGVDRSLPLLQGYPGSTASMIQADASALPFADGVADVVVATAVIEHVLEPRRMAAECRRVLAPGGLLIVTTPSPHMEELATRIGLLDDDQHNETFNLAGLGALVEGAGFEVLEARKFMFSPIGFPCEQAIERALRALGLGVLMANQLLIARRGPVNRP